MRTVKHLASSVVFILVLLISSACIEGCLKNNAGANNTSAAVLLDSVIIDYGSGNYLSIKYIYDNQERVIEERVRHVDTPKTRRTYEYQSNSTLPYKMNSYKGTNTNPEFISNFLYDANGRKIYDSTYAMPGSVFNGDMSVRLDYSVAGQIIIKQEQHPSYNTYYDTVFLNIGNIDSAKTNYKTKWVFSPYTNKLNVFKNLSISSCRFYSPAPNYPGSLFTGLFYSTSQDIPLEYFSSNNYVASTAIFASFYSPSVT